MHYSFYGERITGAGIDHHDLASRGKPHGDLFARAENSGSEACHVEVARWNESTSRWERYAFMKVFGGEHLEAPDAHAVETAELFAMEINIVQDLGTHAPVIHRMPTFATVPAAPVSKPRPNNSRIVLGRRIGRDGAQVDWSGQYQTWAMDANGHTLHCGPKNGPFDQARANDEILTWELWADGIALHNPDCPTAAARRKTVKLVCAKLGGDVSQPGNYFSFDIPAQYSVALPLPSLVAEGSAVS